MKKALLIGDFDIAPRHSCRGLDEVLRDIYKGLYEISLADEKNHGNLSYGGLKSYDIVIFMPQKWPETANKDVVCALITYVVRGGSLLSIHRGLIANNTPELCLLFAARHIDHAAYVELDFFPAENRGELADGVAPVTVDDEPHFFELDVFKKTNVLVELVYGNLKYPAIWYHSWGKGKVACMAPGRSAESITAFTRPLINIGKWMGD